MKLCDKNIWDNIFFLLFIVIIISFGIPNTDKK